MNTHIDHFTLVGLKLPHKTTNANGQSGKDCGDLWQRFEGEKIFDRIKEKVTNEVYAVYYNYEKDETAPFSYFIGCKVQADTKIPTGLDVLIVPAQTYKQFTAKGVMTGCIIEAWESIWRSGIPRRFGFDFEIYDERSHDWSNAEVDIYISLPEN